ncbi:Predicted dehydrogenase [Amphibacillus marinus]|uniref:Predicted dehydrogenase n=1 Tax=Amphibacillus marinus TaxID=872970 RepID=A0A1H8QVK8_9BACI|nr:Gfo/Idh/MocA family oxidoreductase [Amphibacillus marinus]SEO57843.1 Predicted dehydrogenase [Amphibacillus marinus]
MNKVVKWGILSTASIAQYEVIPAFKRASNAEVVAISSLSGRAQEVADLLGIEKAYESYHEVLDDPDIDAVYIPLPNHLHKQWAIMAAEKKKHILCEKPAGLTAIEISEIEQACKANGVIFMEAFMYYLHPQHQRVKQLINDRAIGEVKAFRGTFSYKLHDRDTNIRMTKEMGGGSLYDVGCYPIHAMRNILGLEPSSVYSEAVIDELTDVDVTTISVFKFTSKVLGTVESSFDTVGRSEYEVIGTEGRIYVPRAFRPDTRGGEGVVIVEKAGCKTEEYYRNDLYLDEVEHISHAILTESEPIITVEDTHANMKAIDACYRSISSRKREQI